MKFEWDEHKNQINIQKHNIDFNDAKKVFEDAYRTDEIDNRKDYGEERRKTVGNVLNNITAVIYTLRTPAIRLISARRANTKEKNEYILNHQNKDEN